MSNWISDYTNTSAAASWTDAQRKHNAKIIWKFFKNQFWKLAPIAAMMGNMQYESYLNPGQWELGIPIESTGGFGLVQWTPYTKYSSWVGGADWRTDHDYQLERIEYELNNGLQWIPTVNYPFTFADFSRMDLDPDQGIDIDYLTKAFEYNYERGTWNDQRTVYAEYWYKILKQFEIQRIIIYFKDKKTRVKGVYF